MVESEKVRLSYDAEYVSEEDLIYIAVSTFDDFDTLLSVDVLTVTPIYYEDGSFDAIMFVEGKEIYLSEVLTGSQENCFFFTALIVSLTAAKIIAAIVVAIKVTVVIVAVVAVGYATYQLVRVTKEWINEKTNEQVDAKRKSPNNPAIYYYTKRVSGKLQISSVPETLTVATSTMSGGVDRSYWTPFDVDAIKLCRAVSGTAIGPEIDKSGGTSKAGYYWHYHPDRTTERHVFYSTPNGGVY